MAALKLDPIISVVIPYYQAGQWIEATLRSVIGQDYPWVEVVIVNDGSPDVARLEAALSRLSEDLEAGKVRVVHQANSGPSAARNRGVREAIGEFVAFLDADDCWDPTLLSSAARALTAPPAVDVVFCDGWTTAESGAARWRITSRSPTVPEPRLADVLGGTSTVITSGALVRRARFLEVGGFDETQWRSEDFDLWVRLLRRGARFRAVPLALVHRRQLAGGLSANHDAMLSAARTVLAKQLADPTLDREAARVARRFDRAMQADLAFLRARTALLRADIRAARRAAAAVPLAGLTMRRAAFLAGLLVAPGHLARLLARRAEPVDTDPGAV